MHVEKVLKSGYRIAIYYCEYKKKCLPQYKTPRKLGSRYKYCYRDEDCDQEKEFENENEDENGNKGGGMSHRT